MSRYLIAGLSALAFAAALGLSGCSGDEQDASPQTAPSPTSASLSPTAAAQTNPLPDPVVPGAQKLNLVEGANPENAGVLDEFANALLNGGYAPVKCDVRDV